MICVSQDRLASEKGPKQQKMKEKEEEKEVKEEKVSGEIKFLNVTVQQCCSKPLKVKTVILLCVRVIVCAIS